MELPIKLSADRRTRQVGNFTSPKLGSVQGPLTGPEPLEPADRPGAEAEPVRRAGHDRTAAPRSGGPDPGGEAGGRGGDRRGLRGGRAQGPARGRGQKGRPGRRRKLRGIPGRGTLEKDKPPILGLIQRGGPVVLRMLANVQQITIQPIIEAAVATDTLVHTDEYGVYARLEAWGYRHKTVCHGLPWARRIRPRRGRGWVLRGARQHHRGVLVAAALLAAPAPGHLAGQAAGLSRLLPGRAQRTPSRQSPARYPRLSPGCDPGLTPRNPLRACEI